LRSDPYFHAAQATDGIRVSGTPFARCGHRIERDDGRADGIFADWSWDGVTLSVRNDPYGFHPLFYVSRPGEIGVSTSILRLLGTGAAADLDYEAIAVFLRLGFYVGNDTPFRSIRAVPPGARFTWTRGELTVSGGYWYGKPQRLTRDGALDAYIAAFREAIRRTPAVDDRVVVPLSGGRDSRHILLELCHLGRPPAMTVTIPRYPPRPSEDERVAAMIAERARVRHTLLDQPENRLDAEMRKNWLTHLCADEHAWYMALVDYLEQEATTVYDGMGGALSVAGRFLSPQNLRLFDGCLFSELAETLLRNFGIWSEDLLQHVLAEDLRPRLARRVAVERLATDLALHAAAPDPSKSFNFWNRTRREIALVPYGLMNRVPQVFSPYLDVDVYELLSSLPPSHLSPDLTSPNKSFHSDAIKRAYPAFADIPFEDSHAPKLDARPHYARFAADVSRHLFGAFRRPFRTLANGYVWPRMMLALPGGAFGASRPWLPILALYMCQLETAAQMGDAFFRAEAGTVTPHVHAREGCET
jgi:hypothetical protein